MKRSPHFLLLLLFTLSLPAFAFADDEAASPADIPSLVKQLDDDDFATRQAAQKQLEAAGVDAIEAVQEAALGESQEAAVRAIDILKKHSRSEDAALKKAGEAALNQLAEGENPMVADRAKSALKPEEQKPDAAQQGIPIGPRVVPFGGGGIRIEARAIAIGGDGAKKISVKNVDGNKEIDVEEKDRKIKITESAEGKIKMSISTKVGDMETTKDYEAESAEDLEKQDAEAHKIYEKYSKQGGIGGGRIEFRALPAGPRGIPRIRIAPAVPGAAPRAIRPASPAPEFDDAIKRLEEARKRMEDAEDIKAESIDKAIQRLEKLREELEARKAELEEAKEE